MNFTILAVPQPVIAFSGVLLNALFIIAVALNKNMHTITNNYLVNLAIADLMFLTFYTTYSTIKILTKSPFTGNWVFLRPYGCFFVIPVYFLPYKLWFPSEARFMSMDSEGSYYVAKFRC